MKICTILIAILFATTSFAQADSLNTPVPPPPVDSGSNDLFQKVEVEATVDPLVWRHHLEKALMPVMTKAIKKKIPAGTYTVNVRFLVERDGSISNVEAKNDPGYGLAEGAVKVVQSGPDWIPGVQNGQKVRSYRTQPITFVFTKD